MSTGGNGAESPRINYDKRSALISLVACCVFIGVFYLLGGRHLLRSAKVTEETRVAQQAAEEKIRSNEQTVNELQSQLRSVRDSFQANESQLTETETIRARLEDIEQSLGELPNLVGEAKTQVDASVMRNARSRAEFVAVAALMEKCSNGLDELMRQTRSWQSELTPLLQDDRGRRLASDPDAVLRFLVVSKEEHPTVADIAAWTQEFNEASRPIREAVAKEQREIQTTPDDRAYFEAILTRVESASLKLTRSQEVLRLLLVETSEQPVATRTLEQALAVAEQEALNRFVEEANQERMAKLKAAVDEQSKALQEAEEIRIAAETEMRVAEKKAQAQGIRTETQRLDNEIDEAAAAAARRKLEAEFARDQPEIQSLLAPFLAESVTHPNLGNPNDPHTWIIRAGDLIPVSFGRLQSSGSLADTHEGRHRLYYFAGSADSIRPKQGFPAYSRTGLNNPAIVDRISRAQALLTKYGPLMVEKGMLYR